MDLWQRSGRRGWRQEGKSHGLTSRTAAEGLSKAGSRRKMQAMTQAEFEAIAADTSKRIEGNISWSEDEDHSPTVEFRADVSSEAGYPLFVRGSYNPEAQKLSFGLIHRGVGRIYALDLGSAHHNPSCDTVGDTHKHNWSELTNTKEAYVPPDITASVAEPVVVWRQFCAEARITHVGVLHSPLKRLGGKVVF